MKTKTLLRTCIATIAMGSVLFASSCKKPNDGPKPTPKKPKVVEIAYKVSSDTKDLKLTSLIVANTKGKDSVLNNPKLPLEAKMKAVQPKKGTAFYVKVKGDKPAKVNFELMIDGKSVNKQTIEIKDAAKDEIKYEHKLAK